MSASSDVAYRVTGIGKCLIESLSEMMIRSDISQVQAGEVLKRFDAAMINKLSTEVNNKIQINGFLHTYRNCDGIWTLMLQDAQIYESIQNMKYMKSSL